MDVLMNAEICGKIGGYVTADATRCVLGCPDGEFVLKTGVCATECESGAFTTISSNAEKLQRQCVEESECGPFYSEQKVLIGSEEKVYRQCHSGECPEDRLLDQGDAAETCQTAEKCAARGKLAYETARLCVSLAECAGER